MENATKALVIAATVLITVLVISLGVYLFTQYSEVAYQNEKNRADQIMVQYNTKFTKYIDKSMSIHDVITVANLAKEYNEGRDYRRISVRYKGSDISNMTYDNLVKQYLEKSDFLAGTYNMSVEYYKDSDGTESKFIQTISIN